MIIVLDYRDENEMIVMMIKTIMKLIIATMRTMIPFVSAKT